MRLKVVDIDEAQEFLLTKDYLEQCQKLLPDDHRIFAYNEVRTILEHKQW